MKATAYMAVLAAAFLAYACSCAPDVQEGVSDELAGWRVENISDVCYDIHFIINESRSEPVHGSVDISFADRVAALPQIDFDAPKDHLFSVRLNGETVGWRFEKGHILVDAFARTTAERDTLSIFFTASAGAVNRTDSLISSRKLVIPAVSKLMPCFAQADIPATYKLQLTVPQGWQASSVAPLLEEEDVSPLPDSGQEATELIVFQTCDSLRVDSFTFFCYFCGPNPNL